MADSNVFRHGGVEYPLTESTAKSLLEDADPARFHTLAFFAAMLRIHLGARLRAQAALEKLMFPDAVVQTIFVEPSPHLLGSQMKFPLLALYRRSEESDEASIVYDRDISEWEFAYVLPPLSPRQEQQLEPILRAAARIITKAARKGFDNGYKSGQNIWELAGIEKARVTRASYGVYEPIDEVSKTFRAVVGTLKVVEFDRDTDDKLDPFEGATCHADLQDADGTVLEDLAVVFTSPAPVIENVVPNYGPTAGGTTVTIVGSNFRVGTPVRVVIGGIECSSTQVLSATAVRAVTRAHAAYPNFMADVVVIAADGQEATLPASFSFIRP